ncbi:dihydrolipoyllysine-residue succinyltransferase component of 2-oxoglutarate dehydrogenase complex, mitochondrial [Condylostylus longicornis]|uniref:dihydrolipoyllysine-residue succinyltransferase component of 2-oxoglutarate dehydrogenase complex, mitochondrial n=1 Tax=Condylostylus longicornis TaxID=2530218 RepID=UPI00244DF4FF|nr:dihydrolipoyllysine-residue succinyltransferase component of 2-oxoglutarate dehydrogenase complex, mitochondrial [Condylostylus longicornis]
MSGIIFLSSRRLQPKNFLKLGALTSDLLESKLIPLQRNQKYLINCVQAYSSSCSDVFLRCNTNHILNIERGLHTTFKLYQTETVNVPPFADSVSEGDVKFTCKVGDYVKTDDVVMEIETDKTTVGVPAPFGGVIEEILVKDGDTVKAGQALFKLKKAEGGAAHAPAAKPATTTPPPPPPPPTPSPASKPPSPPKVATPSPPTPPPPAAMPPPPKPAAPSAKIPTTAARPVGAEPQVKLPPSDYSKEITGTRTEQRVKMSRMRLKVGARLKEAQNVNAMLTTFNEIDMSAAMEFRKSKLDAFVKKYGIKIGFMSIFTKASAYALQDQPVVNAVIDGNDIVYRDYVDISVAVATPKGLVVPVLRNVEGMNYADIEIAMAAIAEKARKGAIAVEDMDGGTFTISNGGVFGSLLGTPIINPPQSAILGMHGIFERPIAVKGQVVIRPMMYVALTYDHRLIDGREAVTFLRKIKEAVEDPRIMLAGL